MSPFFFQIVEQGSPAELAARADSQFRQMLDQAGISSVLKPQTLPPLARHGTEPELEHTPATTDAVTDAADAASEVSMPDEGGHTETQRTCVDGDALVADGESDGEGYVNEATRF